MNGAGTVSIFPSSRDSQELAPDTSSDVSVPEPTPFPTPTPTPTPVKLDIPSIGVEAKIVEVSFDKETEEILVPDDAREVGWYKFSPPPGDNGSTILNAHYDTPTGAPAIFYNIEQVQVGEVFKIINDQNKELTYRVRAVRKLPLVGFPTELIYGARDHSQVTLITCAGVFDPATQLYSHRLAVIGVLEETKEVDYIAAIETLEQYVVQGFIEDIAPADSAMPGVYLKLKADQEKISLYLSSFDRDIVAVDAVIKVDPQFIELDPEIISFTNLFEAHSAQSSGRGELTVSLFTDPARGAREAFNTLGQEVKIADIYYSVKSRNAPITQVELVQKGVGRTSSAVLTPIPGAEIHSSEDILNFVQGTSIEL
jgi:LPXTG-site transpeptidase (sortase) family protein